MKPSTRFALSTIVVYLTWSIMDFLIHGVFLQQVYETTSHLWRPELEMKMGVMQLVVFLNALLFNILLLKFSSDISLRKASLFGLVYGASVGLGMGYGTYAVMPIPYILAMSWFFGTVAETVAGGVLVGLIHREK